MKTHINELLIKYHLFMFTHVKRQEKQHYHMNKMCYFIKNRHPKFVEKMEKQRGLV